MSDIKHLHGKKALIPLINRAIPIITDEYVTMDFGTGCLKVTPAHDLNDYELGVKHNLPVIDILNRRLGNPKRKKREMFSVGYWTSFAGPPKTILKDLRMKRLYW